MAKQVIRGTVVSARDKTIIIEVNTRRNHPIYKKQFTITNRFSAHDEKNQASVGDVVEITATAPRSKTKRWELKGIKRSVS